MTGDLSDWYRDRKVESTTRLADPAGAARQELLGWHRRGRGPAAFLEAGRFLAEHGDLALVAARQARASDRVLELLTQALGVQTRSGRGRPRAEVDEAEVRALLAGGHSLRQVAERLGVSKSTIARIGAEPLAGVACSATLNA